MAPSISRCSRSAHSTLYGQTSTWVRTAPREPFTPLVEKGYSCPSTGASSISPFTPGGSLSSASLQSTACRFCHPSRECQPMSCLVSRCGQYGGDELLQKIPRHLRKLGDRIHIASCAILGGRNLELGITHPIRVERIDLSKPHTNLFRRPIGYGLQSIRCWRAIQKESNRPV